MVSICHLQHVDLNYYTSPTVHSLCLAPVIENQEQKESMTLVRHLRTRFPLHINLNKWYWMQPWPLVLLSISTTSAPVYSLLSTPLPMMEWKIHHSSRLLNSAISRWTLVSNIKKSFVKNQLGNSYLIYFTELLWLIMRSLWNSSH